MTMMGRWFHRPLMIAVVSLFAAAGGLITSLAVVPAASAATKPCEISSDSSKDGCLERLTLSGGAKFPYYRTHSLSGSAKLTHLVVVIHGTGRNADEYFRDTAATASDVDPSGRTGVLAPWFQIDEDDRPDGDAYWTNGGDTSWKDGGGALEPRGLSSYQVMDEILRALADKAKFPNLKKVSLIGHSAGGQFMQRYAAGARAPSEISGPAIKFVIANPSSYLYLNANRPVDPGSCGEYDTYKYGLRGLNEYMGATGADKIREQYPQRQVTYLLGSKDVNQDHSIDDSCQAKAQGEHRLARGEAYFDAIKKEFPSARHDKSIVDGVGHDHRGMFDSPAGRKAIFP